MSRSVLLVAHALLLPVVHSLRFAGWLLRTVVVLLAAAALFGIRTFLRLIRQSDPAPQPDWRFIDLHRDPELVSDIAWLSARAGIATPRVQIVASDRAFAFVADRRCGKATIAISDSFLTLLTREERCGVVAHEIAHLCERETLSTRIGAAMTRSLANVARRGPANSVRGLSLVAAGAGALQLFASRRREFLADRYGATLCGNPLWLASALQRLHDAGIETNTPRGAFNDLMSTHPDVSKRIAALRELAGLAPTHVSAARQSPAVSPRWRPFRDVVSPRGELSFLGGRGLHRPAGGPWG